MLPGIMTFSNQSDFNCTYTERFTLDGRQAKNKFSVTKCTVHMYPTVFY